MQKISRRKFLGLGAFALPAVAGIDARWIEPTSLRVTQLRMNDAPRTRFVQFSDFHYKGDAKYATAMVRAINEIAPDFVCFTGDLIEDRAFVDDALGFVRQIKAPVFGVPGNHDYSSHAPFAEYEKAFAATGGEWLPARNAVLTKHDVELIGMGITGMEPASGKVSRRILLIHYPIMADRLGQDRFDLILAGHSHGGQVRVPGFGAIILPPAVGNYEFGYYKSRGGPLYVNAGVGTYILPVRFNCRPELTVVAI